MNAKSVESLTPAAIVVELDKYIVGQKEAKRSVAVALRNRWRRQQVPLPLREEIHPKNILMIGPTGVGKTEIARRLAKLAGAPFLKVEATKYTEVGYVGKDVESMVRDLVEIAINLIKQREKERVAQKAHELAEERLIELLSFHEKASENIPGTTEMRTMSREQLRTKYKNHELDEWEVQLDTKEKPQAMFEVLAVPGLEEMEMNLRDMLGNMLPKKNKKRRMKVKEALAFLEQEEAQRLVDMDRVIPEAIQLAEHSGIIFLDELDKIAESKDGLRGTAGVSREGVQRDLLPIVEGSNVNTKYGVVKTDHILFIGAGAFHQSKPSDLIPELQGRFPIRVELKSLTTDDFVRILTEPSHSLLKQYTALLATEKVDLEFTEGAILTLCETATQVNERTENIGARRLHTILERVLEEVSFNAAEVAGQKIEITADYVKTRIDTLAHNQDLSRYIL